MARTRKVTDPKVGVRATARATGLSAAHVSLILNGKREPSISVAKRLARVWGITIDELARELKIA